MTTHLLFGALALAGVVAGCRDRPSPGPLVFTRAVDGLEHAHFEASGDPAFSGDVFVADLARIEVRMLQAGGAGDRHVVSAIAGALPVHVATNASFFDESNKTMGRVVDRGRVLVGDRRAAWGALTIAGPTARVVLGDTLPAATETPNVDVVVQGLPRLVVAGEVPKLKPAVAERTAVCADDKTARLTLVVSSKADSTDFARFLALPRDKGGLGCTDALNLDGGPSTQLSAHLPGLTLDVEGGWGVPNALVLVPRAPAGPATPP